MRVPRFSLFCLLSFALLSLTLPSFVLSQEPNTVPVRLWPASEGVEFLENKSTIQALAVSADGRTAATGAGRNIILWDTASGKERRRWRCDASVSDLAFNQDASRLLIGSRDKTATLWNTADGKVQATLRHQDAVTAVAFSRDGRFVAAGLAKGQAALWDARNVKPLFPLNAHKSEIRSIAFAPRGNLLAIGSQDRTISLWDTEGNQQKILEDGHKGAVTCVAFDARSNRLISGGADNTVVVWNVGSGNMLHKLVGHSKAVCFVAFAPDGLTAYTVSQDQCLIQWNLQNGKEMVRTDVAFPVRQAAMSQDAYWTVLCDSSSPKTLALKTETLGFEEPQLARPQNAHPFAHLPQSPPVYRFHPEIKPGEPADQSKNLPPLRENRKNLVEFHTKAPFALSVGPDRIGTMWDIQKKDAVFAFSSPSNLTAVEFNPVGNNFAVGTQNGSVTFYHPGNGKQLSQLRGHTSAVLALTFSSDGRWLLSAGQDQNVVLWDLTKDSLVSSNNSHTDIVTGLEMMPDDSKVVSISRDKTVRVWQMGGSTGKLLKGELVAEESSPLLALAIAKNGEWLAIATEDNRVIIRETHPRQDGEAIEFPVVTELKGFAAPVKTLAFTPNSAFLVTGGDDGVPVFWNTQSWEAVQSFPQIRREIQRQRDDFAQKNVTYKKWTRPGVREILYEPVFCIAFSSDGQWMLTSGGRETFLWQVSP